MSLLCGSLFFENSVKLQQISSPDGFPVFCYVKIAFAITSSIQVHLYLQSCCGHPIFVMLRLHSQLQNNLPLILAVSNITHTEKDLFAKKNRMFECLAFQPVIACLKLVQVITNQKYQQLFNTQKMGKSTISCEKAGDLEFRSEIL